MGSRALGEGGKHDTKIVFNPDKDHLKFMGHSEDQLAEVFSGAASGLGQMVYTGSLALRAAEEKKFDTSKWRHICPSFYDFLRLVAYGNVLPGVYGFQGITRRAVAQLPLADQKRLVDGEGVEVLLHDGDVRKIQPADMEPAMVRQTIVSGRIRSISEQRIFLDEENLRGLRKANASPEDSVVVNKKLGVVIITGTKLKFTQKELLDLAQRLSK